MKKTSITNCILPPAGEGLEIEEVGDGKVYLRAHEIAFVRRDEYETLRLVEDIARDLIAASDENREAVHGRLTNALVELDNIARARAARHGGEYIGRTVASDPRVPENIEPRGVFLSLGNDAG